MIIDSPNFNPNSEVLAIIGGSHRFKFPPEIFRRKTFRAFDNVSCLEPQRNESATIANLTNSSHPKNRRLSPIALTADSFLKIADCRAFDPYE
uniref:Uncharacterized protein n=1 Tax=Romanomermis culicivorax TaxID=13658 RepID=A0A915HN78_ROMCU